MKKFLLFVVCCLLFVVCNAQFSTNDLKLIEQQNFRKPEYEKRKVGFLFIGNNPIVRYNPVSLSLGALMYFYQKCMSPMLASKCGYEISCSNFSKKSIQQFGLFKGIALTADRLTRCTPYALIDINPVYVNEQGKITDNPEKYR